MAGLAGVGCRRAARLLLLPLRGGGGKGGPRAAPQVRLSLRLGAAHHMSQTSTEQGSAGENYPGVIESTEEYKFVERLIPPMKIPELPQHDHYPTPSGWTPPQDPPPDLPYYVRRSRMNNIPVYRDLAHMSRKITVIRKIDGDIWRNGLVRLAGLREKSDEPADFPVNFRESALEKEVKEFITSLSGKTPLTQVNEVTGSIVIKGYFEEELKQWLIDKGF